MADFYWIKVYAQEGRWAEHKTWAFIDANGYVVALGILDELSANDFEICRGPYSSQDIDNSYYLIFGNNYG